MLSISIAHLVSARRSRTLTLHDEEQRVPASGRLCRDVVIRDVGRPGSEVCLSRVSGGILSGIALVIGNAGYGPAHACPPCRCLCYLCSGLGPELVIFGPSCGDALNSAVDVDRLGIRDDTCSGRKIRLLYDRLGCYNRHGELAGLTFGSGPRICHDIAGAVSGRVVGIGYGSGVVCPGSLGECDGGVARKREAVEGDGLFYRYTVKIRNRYA